MTLWKWSKTAATNASADSTINWAEGQAPSSVNDSARALMAAVAKYRDDLNGSITTGGTSTAYTVTSNQTVTSNTNGFTVTFVPHATNTGTGCTLAVDGQTALPLRTAPGADIGAGVLIAGTPYRVTCYTGTSEWIIHNFYGNPYSVAIGSGMLWVGASPPNSNFVFPYGQAISRTTYATLFGICGTTYGTGDGTFTFNVPDLRGRIPVGWDSMGGAGANRVTYAGSLLDGTTRGATGGAENHVLTIAQLPSHDHTANVTDPGHRHTISDGFSITSSAGTGSLQYLGTKGNYNTSLTTTGISVSISSTGSGVAHNNVQPSIIMPYIIRVI